STLPTMLQVRFPARGSLRVGGLQGSFQRPGVYCVQLTLTQCGWTYAPGGLPVDFQAVKAETPRLLSIEFSASKSPLVIRLPPAAFFWITTSSMIAAPAVNEVKPETKLSSSSCRRLVSTRNATRILPAPALQSAFSDFSSAVPFGSRLMLADKPVV